jgi:thiol:disulfide interchange protein DsbD
MFAVLAAVLCSLAAVGFGQPPAVVQWSASAQSGANPQARLLRLSAVIPKGWHVYGIKQSPGGPTPLVIRIDQGEPYEISGVPQGTIPQKHHDASFDLDTEYFTDSVELNVPVTATRPEANIGVPLSVRFQMCSDTACLPPKTIHLVAKLGS